MSNIVLETRNVGKISGNFVIPAYQRGYRWGEAEVRMLLNDLYSVPDGKKYCLQPIVVKRLPDDKYELIDGQQRLTTLYLLYRYLKRYQPMLQIKYNIDYAVREESRTLLTTIDYDNLTDNYTNIDEFFVKQAAKNIMEWFGERDDDNDTAISLTRKLNSSVSVIWYEVDDKEDGSKLFSRLNIGKIPLTNAELVRALFLSRTSGIDERYQLEISTQWDSIEHELSNPNLWYFATNRSMEDYMTKIELIFDIMAGKKADDRERYRTFFYFMDKVSQSKYAENKIGLWREVIATFQRLKEWYNNRVLYHKVGYLIAVRANTFAELMNMAGTMKKDEFADWLNNRVADTIQLSTNKDYADLSYGKDGDMIHRILLLFNVESTLQCGDKSMRFPFDKHKGKNGGWSLEHIHARLSEGLKNRKEWNKWLDLHLKALKDMQGDEEIITRIENRDREKFERTDFDNWVNEILQELDDRCKDDYIDMLGNMALLGTFDNAALNNSVFAVKRDEILDMDRSGEYIPLCTRRVFLKYYTPSEDNQIHFWGEADRRAYLKAMNGMLKPYLADGRQIGH